MFIVQFAFVDSAIDIFALFIIWQVHTDDIMIKLPKVSLLIMFYSNQPTSVAPQSGATRGLVALRLERGSVLFKPNLQI